MRRRKRIVKPSKKVREVLDVITEVLNVGDGDSCDLWDVLSALRGPDDEQEQSLKYATTTVIRHHAFGSAISEPDTGHASVIRRRLPYMTHFTRHAKYAFTALGLDWNRKN